MTIYKQAHLLFVVQSKATMTDMSIQHGEITFIHEIFQQQQHQESRSSSVRVIGRCVQVDALQKRMALAGRQQYQDQRLEVDTELIPDMRFAVDSLYQFIGELRWHSSDSHDGRPVLRARVGRQVDGMDLSLYEQAVRIRRAFLESTSTSLGKGSSD